MAERAIAAVHDHLLLTRCWWGALGLSQRELADRGDLVREAQADVDRLEEMHQQRLESIEDLSGHNRTLAAQMVTLCGCTRACCIWKLSRLVWLIACGGSRVL